MRKPFWKASHRAWYVHHNGKVVRLAAEQEDAYTRWEDLKKGKPVGVTLSVLAKKFLEWCERNRAKETVLSYRRCLDRWTKHHGTKCVLDIKPFHLDEILQLEFKTFKNRPYSKTTHFQFYKVACVAFRWAKSQGLIETNPLGEIKDKPRCQVRQIWIKPDEFDKVLASTDDPLFRELLVALWDTGARPHEIFKAEAKLLDREARCIRYPKGKGDRPRVVYLTPRVFEYICRLADHYPEGPLYRNSYGSPWTANLVSARLRVLTQRTKIKTTAYCFRHSFATRAILNGVDLRTLQELMGHASLAMLSQVYAHLGGQNDHLHAALGKLGMS